jgi:uncharacterized protein
MLQAPPGNHSISWGGEQMNRIRIAVDGLVLEGELNDSATAQQIWAALPLEASGSTWGDEIYLEIPVVAEQAPDARADVAVGELAYWPVGRAFCIFYGPTPASTGPAPRAYSPVNVVGQIKGDATALRSVRPRPHVRLARAD